MKIASSTLGCPAWDLRTICKRAAEAGYDGIDFRGLLSALDVTALPAFTTDAAATHRRICDAGLCVSGISSSITICDRAKAIANIEEAKRTIPVARAFECRHVRVFGGGNLAAAARDELARVGVDCMQSILALDGATELRWLFETHDNWVHPSDCRRLLDAIPHPAFGALWDIGHTPRFAGATPEETLRVLGPRIGYTHVKDAVFDPAHPRAFKDGWRYVLPGLGQIPLVESIRLLQRQGYDGWLTFEHEKRWHPELPEPEEAFPHFARWARGIIG